MNGPKIYFTIPLFGGIGITQTTVSSFVVMLLLCIAAVMLGSNLQKRPSRRQVLVEKGVTMLYDMVESTMGKHNSYWTPYIGALFLSSICGSFIGMTGIFRSSTADLSTTVTWALMTSFICWGCSIKRNGVGGWLKGFTEPIVVMTPMNLVSEIAQPISMAFRHFGNIAGGSVLTSLVYSALATVSAAVLGLVGKSVIVGVLVLTVGAASSEHDVSLRSGQGLYSFFDKERYNIYLVDVKGTDWHVAFDNGETAEIDKNDFSFVKDGKHVYFDYAYITIHGQPGENGVMQGYFDLIHLPYSTSGVLVEAMTFDKYVLNNYLRGFGVNVADSILLRRGEQYDEDEIAERIGMPCFVKPAADGSSFGVSKVKNADQLAPALRVAFMESNEVMIEGFLDGTEISQGIYKTAEKTVVLPATEVVTSNEFFDYDAKYNGQVQEITPARLSPETAEEVAKTTSRIYDILHANGIIRIDYIISKDKDGKDKVNMLEINTTPGMTVTSFIPQQVRAAGLDIKDVLSDIVENQF